MNCQAVKLPDGAGVAIVCGGRRRAKCKTANCTSDAVALCDWKLHTVEGGKRRYSGARCSMRMCAAHCPAIEPDKHLCPFHYRRAEREGLLPVDGAQKASD